jgi:phosphoserine aminotransferase
MCNARSIENKCIQLQKKSFEAKLVKNNNKNKLWLDAGLNSTPSFTHYIFCAFQVSI